MVPLTDCFLTILYQYTWNIKDLNRLTGLSPPVNIFTDRSKAVLLLWIFLCYFCLVLLCFHARLFVDALGHLLGKGWPLLLSFVVSNCDVVTFPLVSWVRCGAHLNMSEMRHS